MKLETGDLVIYGKTGVCRVQEIGERTFDRKSRMYYILKPVDDDRATIYAPTDSQQIQDKMRRLMTREEILQLVRQIPQEPSPWIFNENLRKDTFRRILSEGDRMEMIQMIRCLYRQKRKRAAAGRKIHSSDEHFFREAERLVFEEVGIVLHLKKNQVISLLFHQDGIPMERN